MRILLFVVGCLCVIGAGYSIYTGDVATGMLFLALSFMDRLAPKAVS